MVSRLEKIYLSDKEYEIISKGIVFGVLVGTLIGMFIGEVVLFFSLGGVLGIISTTIYTITRKIKAKKII
ncbi:MAG: hypothetical protein RR940_03930 [Bacilli bacterium]